MSKRYEFFAIIKKAPDINGAYVEIPFDVKDTFGMGRVLVHATFDGEKYDGLVVKMGTPCHIIGITRAIRDKIGKQAGDEISVTIEERVTNQPAYKTVNEYISQYSGETKERIENIRELILSCSKDITEKISWGMPTFVLNGNLVHFSVAKQHIGFYPDPSAIEHFAEQLTEYKCSKGAIRFQNKEPIPYELTRKIVQFRVQEMIKK